MKELPILFSSEMVKAILDGRKTQTRRIMKPQPDFLPLGWKSTHTYERESPKQPGDLLYVRESWCRWESGRYFYKANYDYLKKSIKWKPSIHMPKTAARIWLKVTDVRVERLKDISEKDALLEGINSNNCSGDWEHTPSSEFQELWVRINGQESWDANPWVWVIEFSVESTTGRPKTAEQPAEIHN